MSRICTLDYDEFIAQLRAMGLTGGSYYVEHGRMQHGAYGKKRLEISVYPEGEANYPIDNIDHDCIKFIQIH